MQLPQTRIDIDCTCLPAVTYASSSSHALFLAEMRITCIYDPRNKVLLRSSYWRYPIAFPPLNLAWIGSVLEDYLESMGDTDAPGGLLVDERLLNETPGKIFIES